MKVNFSFQTRQGMAVACAVAEEIENNISIGNDFGTPKNGIRPTLLSINGDTFRFEGGTVVKLNMVELSQFEESWRTPKMEEWVVTSAVVRYYERDKSYSRVSDVKKEETWDHSKLLVLKNVRWWHHPHVRDINSIKGRVGIFFNHAAGDGYVEPDYERNQDGHYTLQEEFDYRLFVPGDRERAIKQAEIKLSKY